ncbi:DNA polymerase III subunit delta' [Thermodesulfobacteriota bacterium]
MAFSKIIGQEKAKEALMKAMAKEKLPHAYLFTGIPGIGKTSTARALAMALNCPDTSDGESCGKCPSCRQMLGVNSPDFLIVKRESNSQVIKIEQIRELNRSLSFAPFGKYRICVFAQAERMNVEAANSFLKTLEEPPPGNVLVLNTTEPRDLLPTIVSRCQKIRFQPLSRADITQWLVRNKNVDEDTAGVLGAVSGGSLGRALVMCDGDFLEKRLLWLSRIEKLAEIPRDTAFSLASLCADEAKKIGLDPSDSVSAGILDVLSLWGSWYRDVLFLKIDAPAHLVVNMDFIGKLKKIERSFKIEHLVESLWLIDQAQRDLRKSHNIRLVVEYTAMRLNRLATSCN